jgi:hypothetical protein
MPGEDSKPDPTTRANKTSLDEDFFCFEHQIVETRPLPSNAGKT